MQPLEHVFVLDCMSRAAEAVSALAGCVQAGKIKNKVDVQHGLEMRWRLADAVRRSQPGKQLLRVAE